MLHIESTVRFIYHMLRIVCGLLYDVDRKEGGVPTNDHHHHHDHPAQGEKSLLRRLMSFWLKEYGVRVTVRVSKWGGTTARQRGSARRK